MRMANILGEYCDNTAWTRDIVSSITKLEAVPEGRDCNCNNTEQEVLLRNRTSDSGAYRETLRGMCNNPGRAAPGKLHMQYAM